MNNEEEEETACIKWGDVARPGKQLDQTEGRKGTKSVHNSLETLIGYAEKQVVLAHYTRPNDSRSN